jgi:hypothetical protein
LREGLFFETELMWLENRWEPSRLRETCYTLPHVCVGDWHDMWSCKQRGSDIGHVRNLNTGSSGKEGHDSQWLHPPWIGVGPINWESWQKKVTESSVCSASGAWLLHPGFDLFFMTVGLKALNLDPENQMNFSTCLLLPGVKMVGVVEKHWD